MARYRRIDTKVWNDETFRRFSDDGKLMFLFVLTHPQMTMIGAMRATVPGLAAELGWTIARMRKAIGEALAAGSLAGDEEASFLCAPNFLQHNPPASCNAVRAWAKCAELLPECTASTEHWRRVEAYAQGMTDAFLQAYRDAFPDGVPMACVIQENRISGEQENRNPPTPPRGKARQKSQKSGGASAETIEAIYQAYPKLEAKQTALRFIAKVLKGGAVTPDGLLDAVRRYEASEYVQTRKGTPDWKFVPLCASWMNAGRWADEVVPYKCPSRPNSETKADVERRREQDAEWKVTQWREAAASKILVRHDKTEVATALSAHRMTLPARVRERTSLSMCTTFVAEILEPGEIARMVGGCDDV